MSMNRWPIGVKNPSTLPLWTTLQESAKLAKSHLIGDYFETDPNRSDNLQLMAGGLTADISRHHFDSTIHTQLIGLAEACGTTEAIQALKNSEKVNLTEDRPALHSQQRLALDDANINPKVSQNRKKIAAITKQVHSGQWLGYSKQPIKDIVNIGIGGSDLGPRMATEALRPFHQKTVSVHYVANIDPNDLDCVLSSLNPATTLFIVASKSWSTLETLANASTAKQWISQAFGNQECIASHFIAITSQQELCEQFGIATDNILPMQDGVGGRFSLWTSIGLSVALATSAEHFEELLAGAHAMDKHFFSAPLATNLPVTLALLEIWYVNFWDVKSTATLPYSHDLRLLPDHLQQLAMESNGKSVDRNGDTINYDTCPAIWGSAGTIGQHSFHQLLHQGTHLIPVDFILPLKSHSDNQKQHDHLISNCLAQSQALMDGLPIEKVKQKLMAKGLSPEQANALAPHQVVPGNRPSTIISMDSLTPATLGALIALYEHKVYSQSIIWNINAFDQWGVELGKVISNEIYPALRGESIAMDNPATASSVANYLNQKSK